jgi:hypothetical protein
MRTRKRKRDQLKPHQAGALLLLILMMAKTMKLKRGMKKTAMKRMMASWQWKRRMRVRVHTKQKWATWR